MNRELGSSLWSKGSPGFASFGAAAESGGTTAPIVVLFCVPPGGVPALEPLFSPINPSVLMERDLRPLVPMAPAPITPGSVSYGFLFRRRSRKNIPRPISRNPNTPAMTMPAIAPVLSPPFDVSSSDPSPPVWESLVAVGKSVGI